MTVDEFDMVHKHFPAPPLWLTLSGILPFLGTTGALFVWRDDIGLALTAALWLLVYAAMILSFLGGVRWGVEILREAPRWSILGLSVLGALAGWALVMAAFNPVIKAWMLALMALFYGLHFGFDRMSPDLPDWYRKLRLWPTIAALFCLGFAAILLGRM